MDGEGESRDTSVLTVGGQLLGVAALLLPAVGVGARWVAFTGDDKIDAGLSVAIAAPIQVLVATGAYVGFLFFSIALVAIWMRRPFFPFGRAVDKAKQTHDDHRSTSDEVRALLETGEEQVLRQVEQLKKLEREAQILAEHAEELRRKADEARPRDVSRRTLRVPAWASPVLLPPLAAIILFVPDTAWTIASILAAMVFKRQANVHPRMTLATMWPALTVSMLIVTVGAGIEGWLPALPVGKVTFSDQASPGLTDGDFVQLGQSEGVVHLRPCGTGPVVVVPEAAIAAFEVTPHERRDRPTSPSLFDVLFRDKRLTIGMSYTC